MPALFWTTPELWHFGRFCGGTSLRGSSACISLPPSQQNNKQASTRCAHERCSICAEAAEGLYIPSRRPT